MKEKRFQDHTDLLENLKEDIADLTSSGTQEEEDTKTTAMNKLADCDAGFLFSEYSDLYLVLTLFTSY